MGETEKSGGNLWQLTMCCCGCTLKTGSLIIASLEMIGGLIYFGVGFGFLIYFNTRPRYDSSNENLLYGIMLAIGVFCIAHAATLIHGARKRRQGFLLCWIIIQTIVLVLSVIGGIYMLVTMGTAAIIDFLYLVLGLYFLLVVKSHRQELLDSKQDGPVNEMENKTYNNMYPTKHNEQKV